MHSPSEVDESCTANLVNADGRKTAIVFRDKALADKIGFVYSKPLLDAPSSSSGHYGGNAKTYMNVGLALGARMAELVK